MIQFPAQHYIQDSNNLGHHLVGDTLPSPEHPYADWLTTYIAPDFNAVGAWIRERLDFYTINLPAIEKVRLHEIFKISTIMNGHSKIWYGIWRNGLYESFT